MEFLKNFWEYIRVRKKYWLLPIMLALLSVGSIIIVAEGTAVAPWIYAIF